MTAPLSVATRRKARGVALQVLYAIDLGDVDVTVDGWVDSVVATYGERFEMDIDGEARELAAGLVRAASSDAVAIEERIAGASRNWRIDRMARVDRNILRLAVGELMHASATPVRVVINEAVELAKRFGTAEAPAFVNGVLDRIASALGRHEAAGAADSAAIESDGEPDRDSDRDSSDPA
jgi:N utilization substance protein B